MPDGGIAFAEWLRKKKLTIGNPVTFPKYGTARLRLKRFPDDELELVQTRSEKYTDRNSRDPSTLIHSTTTYRATECSTCLAEESAI